jgi:hypothetical protein
MTGLEHALERPALLGAGGKVGLLTNPTGVTRNLEPAAVALLRAGVGLERLLAPEHGIDGSGQAGEAPERERDPATGLPVLTTYRRRPHEIAAMLEGLDAPPSTSRTWAAASTPTPRPGPRARGLPGSRVRLVVLDRPNPLGFGVEGPVLEPPFRSFVGFAELPLRHGLTLGEAARHLAAGWDGLSVVPCDPLEAFGPGGLPWVPPSPNVPDLETARLYPGTGLVEGERPLGGPWHRPPLPLARRPGPRPPPLRRPAERRRPPRRPLPPRPLHAHPLEARRPALRWGPGPRRRALRDGGSGRPLRPRRRRRAGGDPQPSTGCESSSACRSRRATSGSRRCPGCARRGTRGRGRSRIRSSRRGCTPR